MSKEKKIGARKYSVFIRYAVVGCSGTAIDLGALYILVDFLGMTVISAATVSFLLAVINNFILNKYWTFENRHANIRKQFIKFLIVSTVGLLWNVMLMALFVYGLKVWYIAAKIFTSGFVLSWNFIANKYWTFRDRVFPACKTHSFDYDVTVLIPAYNEERRIAATIRAVNAYFDSGQLTRQIVVINDGSDDDTAGVVGRLQHEIEDISIISHYPNRGKGYAVKKGIESSGGKVILFTDADNSTPIEEFERFQPLLKDHKVVIGSRYLPGSDIVVQQPRYRTVIGRSANLFIRFMLLDGIRDTQCGFKAFEHNAAREIACRMTINGFGFDTEMLSIARLLGFNIKESPVSWYNSSESRIRPVRDSVKTFLEVVKIKLNLWGGRYR